jgi:two-component system response regulator NreC
MQRHLAESPRPAAAMGRTGFALSDRERELLRLIARGRTHQEIAAALGLAADAVEHEYADLTNKLGVHGRVGLVRFAREQGLV